MYSWCRRYLSTEHVHGSIFADATSLGGDYVFTAGAVVTVCTSASCGGAFSVYGSVDPVNYRATGGMQTHWDTGYLYGASIVAALGTFTKIVAELNLVGHRGDAHLADSALAAGAGTLGVRFFGKHVAFTAGAFLVARQARPTFPNAEDGPLILPALSLVGRWDLPSAPRTPGRPAFRKH